MSAVCSRVVPMLMLVLASVSVFANGITPFSSARPGVEPPAPWVHQTPPKVERANDFALVADDGATVLRIESNAAASTWLHGFETPVAAGRLAWRWKVSNPVVGSDFTRKDGDDYAARVYVLFDYPVDKLGFGDRLKISLARTFHDVELPAAAIAYVWGTAQQPGEAGPNPYTDRVRMLVIDSGEAGAGQWHSIERDLAADFERLFGEPAPPVAGIAVGADTDNTGERVTTWFGDLRLVP
ncbi:hypothetical protein C0099_04150 [Pseudazoarcus pumilus]|uniref:DUF3047 domain-containing protein n=2 Tax=Pseudazoarcus pumilus TaxID=2067960 RepID=A0A2I6S4L6_9RHOO|nr:hypothetical protein C0099_04150 [Pseudazoarcus pumilus]